jgi:hypothetical protein
MRRIPLMGGAGLLSTNGSCHGTKTGTVLPYRRLFHGAVERCRSAEVPRIRIFLFGLAARLHFTGIYVIGQLFLSIALKWL